jgi:hypothetical protein
MSRLPSFRARQIDVNTQLLILRSAEEVTDEPGAQRIVSHGHVHLDRENEEARALRSCDARVCAKTLPLARAFDAQRCAPARRCSPSRRASRSRASRTRSRRPKCGWCPPTRRTTAPSSARQRRTCAVRARRASICARARSRGSRARAYVAAGFKRDTELVEYDLDNEDEDWLTTFNGAQNRLPAEKCAPAAGLP